jgi:hypothetical protein
LAPHIETHSSRARARLRAHDLGIPNYPFRRVRTRACAHTSGSPRARRAGARGRRRAPRVIGRCACGARARVFARARAGPRRCGRCAGCGSRRRGGGAATRPGGPARSPAPTPTPAAAAATPRSCRRARPRPRPPALALPPGRAGWLCPCMCLPPLSSLLSRSLSPPSRGWCPLE